MGPTIGFFFGGIFQKFTHFFFKYNHFAKNLTFFYPNIITYNHFQLFFIFLNICCVQVSAGTRNAAQVCVILYLLAGLAWALTGFVWIFGAHNILNPACGHNSTTYWVGPLHNSLHSATSALFD